MMRSATTLAILSILAASVTADEADQPQLGKVFDSDVIRYVTATSEDRAVSTLLFENLVLATSDGKGTLLESRTKSFSMANKIEAKDPVSISLDIRGFIATAAGGSAALIVQTGNETTMVDLTRSIAAAASKPRNQEDEWYVAALENAKASGLELPGRPKESEDYMVRISAKLEKGQPLQATVLLLVNRLPSASSSALITVDSIDVSVKPAPAEKKNSEQSPEVTKSEKKSTDTGTTKKSDGEKSEKSDKSVSRKSESVEKPAVKKTSAKKSDSKDPSNTAKSGD